MPKQGIITALAVVLIVIGIVGLGMNFGYIPVPLAVFSTSWNPNVICTPTVITYEELIGTTVTSFGGGSLQGSKWGSYDLGYVDANGNNLYDFGELIVFDTDRDGITDGTSSGDAYVTEGEISRGDRLVSIFPERGIGASSGEAGLTLKKDMKIKFIDGTFTVVWFDNGSTLNTSFDPDETLIYDTNDNGIVDVGEKRVNVTPVVDATSTEIGKVLSVATHGGVPNKRDLSPDCTYVNRFGEVVSTFVQINGVFPTGWKVEIADCDTIFNGINGGGLFTDFDGNGQPDQQCDNTGNWQTFGLTGSCSSTAKEMCIHRTHNEIDHNWLGKGWCGAGTVCDPAPLVSYVQSGSTLQTTSIDIQGFIFFDSPHTQTGHNYHGWEIHPLTAWRLTPAPPSASVSFTWSPTNPLVGQNVLFSVSITTTVTNYTLTWNWGDGSTSFPGKVLTASHTWSNAGTYLVALWVIDTSNTILGSYAVSIIVSNPAPTLVVDWAFSPSSPLIGQTVIFTGIVSGGQSPYLFQWNFGDGATATGAQVSHSYSTVNTFSFTLTVSDNSFPVGTSSKTGSISVALPPPTQLTISFTWTPINPQPGQNVVFLSSVSGGTSPFLVTWNFGDGASGSGLTTSHSYLFASSYLVRAVVSDATSQTVFTESTITVQSPPGKEPSIWIYLPYILLGSGAILATTTAVIGVRRK